MLQLSWVTHHAGRGSHGPQSSNQLRRQPCPRSQESDHRSQAPRSPGCCAWHCPPPSPPQAARQEETPEAREGGCGEGTPRRAVLKTGRREGQAATCPPRRPPARRAPATAAGAGVRYPGPTPPA
uniref:Uncharacterized protein n=1 Tax=Myotis myotis TaxID=51298 RepID=A0A7J7TIA4_MYOMY|nr:hypothetical protein mMyoMyo1_009019 [Myotis myotis]